MLDAATTPEELFHICDWKADLAEVLVLAGWRDAKEDFTLYTTTSPSTRRRGRRAAWWCSWRYDAEGGVLLGGVFMEILLGQHDLNAQHLHDLDAMSNSVLADSLERWIN